MTVTNPDLSRTESEQRRPLLVSFVAHVILGYSLYGIALMQTAPPLWAVNFIEQLKPTLGALDTAARLSEHSFPTQVMILYAVLSSLLLGMYWAYSLFFVNHIFQEACRGMCEQWQQTGIPVKERLKVRLNVGASSGERSKCIVGKGRQVHCVSAGNRGENCFVAGRQRPCVFDGGGDRKIYREFSDRVAAMSDQGKRLAPLYLVARGWGSERTSLEERGPVEGPLRRKAETD